MYDWNESFIVKQKIMQMKYVQIIIIQRSKKASEEEEEEHNSRKLVRPENNLMI